MARPRGDDWLEEEINMLKKRGVSIFVSLLESDEIKELGLTQESEICIKKGINYINFPIPDRDLPKDESKTNTFIKELTEKVREGCSIVIHCRMGIGRSSLIAACILLKSGFETDQIIQKIIAVRGLKVPDTDAQLKWLKNREKLSL